MLSRLSNGVKVLKQCDALVALYKPSQVLSHPVRSRPEAHQCLFDCSYDFEEECYVGNDGKKLYLCNRIDKGTSGIIMASETRTDGEALKALFKAREVDKQYVALCHGRISNLPDEEKVWIDRVVVDRSEGKQARVKKGDGVEAVTMLRGVKQGFFPLVTGENIPILRVDIAPRTGITHQLRYQLFQRGLPIVNDRTYCTRASQVLGKLMQAEGSSGHLMLHSGSIRFPWKDGEFFAFCPLPPDMRVVLNLASIPYV